MRIVMISNYLNHHQIPFCNEICRQTADAEQDPDGTHGCGAGRNGLAE